MDKLLVILGPHASGKSDLAIKIAQLFNGEIISADSRQIYQGMNIGTGKVLRDDNKNLEFLSSGIRHHLLDIVSPQEYFSVAQYQKLALDAISDILQRGKLPIICGGTGLYISATIEGWQLPKIKPQEVLRQELERLTTQELFQKLKKLAPERAQTIDQNNKRRLVRALEIILSGQTIAPLKKQPLAYDIFIIGIKRSNEELKQRIKLRLEQRLTQGMIEEIKKLKNNGVSSQRLEDFGLEYRWINRYLENKVDFETMKNNLYRDICQYAKRQMTWFTRQIFACPLRLAKQGRRACPTCLRQLESGRAKQNLDGFKKHFNTHWVSNKEEAIKLVREFFFK